MTARQEQSFYNRIGIRIRMCREMAEMSQEYLAKKAKITRTSITNIEAGRQRVSLHTLARISWAMGRPPSDIVEWAE